MKEVPNYTQPTTLSHIQNLPHTTKKQQFILLSTISNYHWYGLPSLRSSLQVLTEHLAYSQHLLHDPSIEQNDDGFFLRKYPPMSPRNRIMYLLSNGEEGLHATLKRCLEIPQEQNLIDDTIEQPIEEPVKKRRRKQSS